MRVNEKRLRFKYRPQLAFAVVLLTLATAVCAEENTFETSKPSAMAVLPELMEPGFEPRLGTYYYRFRWILRIGADAEVVLERHGDDYVISTTIQTGWLVDRIYRLRYRGSTRLAVADLSPIRVDIKEEVRSSRKQARMLYRDGTIYSDRVKKKKDDEPRYQSYSQSTRNGRVMDPFSATLIARAMPWRTGDVRTIDIFDGRRMNQVTMECIGKSEVESLGRKRSTWVVTLKIVQGDPDNLDEDDELITDQVTVYMSDDDSREVLQIEANTKFGDIKVFLEDFQPAT